MVLACATSELSEEGALALDELLRVSLSWQELVELADWHRLSPVLFKHLRRWEFRSRVPADVMRELEAAYYTTATRNAHALQELARVLEVLSAQAIPTILLKGSALLGTVYEDSALRSMSDVDLLLHQEDLERADRALKEQGFRPVYEPRSLQAAPRPFRHDPPLFNPQGTVSFELHRDIVSPPLRYDLEGFWARATPTTVEGMPCSRPAPEHLLAHLCLHFFMDRHALRPAALKELWDLAEVMRCYRSSFDWDLFLAEAVRNDVAGAFYCALASTRELLGAGPPDPVLEALTPPDALVTDLRSFLAQRVLGTAPWPLRSIVPAGQPYTPVVIFGQVVRRIFPSSDFLERRYGHRTRWRLLRYLWHITGLVGRWGRRWRDFGLRPRGIGRDWQTDRWLHSLYGTGAGGPKEGPARSPH